MPGTHALHCPFEAPESGPVYPALHKHCTALKFATGVLFHAQQSCDSIVPERDLYPTGHASHDEAAVRFENVSAAHRRHGPALGVSLYEPAGQDVHSELLLSFRAYP